MFPHNGLYEDFEENLGGSLKVDVGFDFLQIDVTADSDKLVDAMEIISSAVTSVEISKKTVAEARTVNLAKAKFVSDSAKHIADAAAVARLYGAFPYARSVHGTAESLKKVDFADLISARERFVTADNATLSITGDVEIRYAHRAARRLFGNWKKSNRIIPSNFTLPESPETGHLVVNTDTGIGVEERLAVEAVSRTSPDYFAARILTRVLNSKLSDSDARQIDFNCYLLRGYLIYSETVSPTTGPTETAVAPEVGDAAINPLAKLIGTKVTQVEFDIGKRAEIDSYLNRRVAEHWFDVATYGLKSVTDELTKLKTVELASVQKVAENISDKPFVHVSVMPLSSVDPEKAGDPNDPR
jgi:predicted Zn-dependent peptidase